MDQIILRRARFLLDEARNGMNKRDVAITYTLRSISNYLTVGKDGTSVAVKRHNAHMSLGAYECAVSCQEFKLWHKATVNEHEQPLERIWDHIVANREMSSSQLVEYLRWHPYVTVLTSENKRIKRLDKLERYAEANIKVGKVEHLWSTERRCKFNPSATWVERQSQTGPHFL